MKKLIYITVVFGTVLAISSCKKDITLTPSSGVVIDGYFKNQKDINSSLAGMYSAFQEEMTGSGSTADEGYGGRYHYWGEARSDNFTSSTFSTYSTVEMATNTLEFGNQATDWNGLYRVIGRTNLGIQYFPQVPATDPNVTPAILGTAMAQAYALRAESYFYIVRVWGDAPMWTTPYLDITTSGSKPKTKAITLIDSLIIPDLQRAYSLIQKNQTPTVWYVGEAAICAILADVYMWRAGLPGIGSQTDYQNAITWDKQLFLAKGPTGAVYAGASGANLEPTATWKNLFITPAASLESIWSIFWDYTVNGCACTPISASLSNNPLTVDPYFQARWRAAFKTDTRVNKTIDTIGAPNNLNHENIVYKFLNLTPNLSANTPGITPVAGNLNFNQYLTMYRLGDVYLSYAEALAQTGDLTNALRYLNYVYLRARVAGTAAIPATAYTTSQTMEDAILAERQYELFGEGKRWFDLVRTGRVHQIMDPILDIRNAVITTGPNGTIITTPVTTGFIDAPNRYYWPISQSALNANTLLTQNPGY